MILFCRVELAWRARGLPWNAYPPRGAVGRTARRHRRSDRGGDRGADRVGVEMHRFSRWQAAFVVAMGLIPVLGPLDELD